MSGRFGSSDLLFLFINRTNVGKMNKLKDQNLRLQTNRELYIPLEEFNRKVSIIEDRYYQSALSFTPVFEKFRETKKTKEVALPGDFIFLEEFEKQLSSISGLKGAQDHPEKVERLISVLFPALFFEGQMGFIGTPFSKEFSFMTPAMSEMFYSGEWELKMKESLMHPKAVQTVLQAGNCILDKLFYQKKGMEFFSETMCIRHKKTHLEKHYKINIITDFIKVTPLQPLKKLSARQIYQLYDEWDNTDFWLKCFPPENFNFEGIVIGYLTDVTDVEILSHMKEEIVKDAGSKMPDDIFQEVTRSFRSFLELPDIVFGCLQTIDNIKQTGTSWTIIGDVGFMTALPANLLSEGLYGKVAESKEPVIIGDLKELQEPSYIDKVLIDKGYRSLLLTILLNNDGEKIGVFELASKKPYQFSKITFIKLKEAISIYELGNSQWLESLENHASLFIQQHYTSIHPSVEWKFKEVSKKYLRSKIFKDENATLDPIVFKDVYPLFAQADIVGSSTLRNKSIETDLIDNLEQIKKAIIACRNKLEFQLLDIYLSKVEENLERLKQGAFISSDESQIVELLTHEIHPLLRDLQKNYKNLSLTYLQEYFEYLDPKLNIVYKNRKAYEESVSQLNLAISDFIEKEDEKKQKILPHFFEKYTTDGVEYNIYIGESLLKNGGFSGYYLKDFRLWQLILMCKITRLVKSVSKELPVPLTTAQLVFVFNNHLSIRFHMDEKQFEVDGAYNVRYEILKKRIDKAFVKGTNERLTQSGKIAIVWLNEIDKREYLEYLKHLQKKGYITDKIEDLELEKLQGAEGLKALRVTVIDESS